MQLGLTDQIVVVLGAASGIGRAIAQEFRNEQADVVLIDRSPQVAEVAENMMSETPSGTGKVLPIVADVTDYAALEAAAAQVEAEFGPVAHVVFGVGIGSGKYGFPFGR